MNEQIEKKLAAMAASAKTIKSKMEKSKKNYIDAAGHLVCVQVDISNTSDALEKNLSTCKQLKNNFNKIDDLLNKFITE